MGPGELLIVEDDVAIGEELRRALAGSGFAVTWARSGAQVLESLAVRMPDLVLLDLGLPDTDGVLLCRQLRSRAPNAVIVVLTARTTEFEVIVALDAGADDYLTKPFRLAELVARLRAHLRRPAPGGSSSLVAGRLRLDVSARRALIGDTEVPLRPKEFDLLTVLVADAGSALSRERLIAEVWDENWYGSTKTLDVHVSALRRKLMDFGEPPGRITTLRGHGYRYELDS